MEPDGTEPVIEMAAVDIPGTAAPGISVVRGVDWTVRSRDRWLVSGPIRSGKSNVVGVAAGLIRPVSGRHRLFGKDLAELGETERASWRRKVGFVFGGGGRLFSMMTVLENLVLPLRYHFGTLTQRDLERVDGLVEGLELGRHARERPADLPRWVAQRVALARALVLSPSVLVLDEPTSGLSAHHADWWRGFVSEGGMESVPTEARPHTWIVATSESRDWREWKGLTARVEGGRWQVEATGEGLRPAAGR